MSLLLSSLQSLLPVLLLLLLRRCCCSRMYVWGQGVCKELCMCVRQR